VAGPAPINSTLPQPRTATHHPTCDTAAERTRPLAGRVLLVPYPLPSNSATTACARLPYTPRYKILPDRISYRTCPVPDPTRTPGWLVRNTWLLRRSPLPPATSIMLPPPRIPLPPLHTSRFSRGTAAHTTRTIAYRFTHYAISQAPLVAHCRRTGLCCSSYQHSMPGSKPMAFTAAQVPRSHRFCVACSGFIPSASTRVHCPTTERPAMPRTGTTPPAPPAPPPPPPTFHTPSLLPYTVPSTATRFISYTSRVCMAHTSIPATHAPGHPAAFWFYHTTKTLFCRQRG